MEYTTETEFLATAMTGKLQYFGYMIQLTNVNDADELINMNCE